MLRVSVQGEDWRWAEDEECWEWVVEGLKLWLGDQYMNNDMNTKSKVSRMKV